MASDSVTTKVINDPDLRLIVSHTGEPEYLLFPWKSFMTLSEGEQETLEIMADPWWSKNLLERYREYRKNPEKVWQNAVSLEELRDKINA